MTPTEENVIMREARIGAAAYVLTARWRLGRQQIDHILGEP